MLAKDGAEGVKFDPAGMEAAGNTLNKTAEDLKAKVDTFMQTLEQEIGENGTSWNGVSATRFINKVKEKHIPEIEKCHENIRNQGANIKDQANTWVEFDEQ